jgi:hypothetical protein
MKKRGTPRYAGAEMKTNLRTPAAQRSRSMRSRRRQVAVDSLAPIGRIQRWTTCGARSLDSVYVDVPVDVHHLLVCAECTDARDNGLPFRKKGTRPYRPPSKKK